MFFISSLEYENCLEALKDPDMTYYACGCEQIYKVRSTFCTVSIIKLQGCYPYSHLSMVSSAHSCRCTIEWEVVILPKADQILACSVLAQSSVSHWHRRVSIWVHTGAIIGVWINMSHSRSTADYQRARCALSLRPTPFIIAQMEKAW